jgi:hypothetical protein
MATGQLVIRERSSPPFSVAAGVTGETINGPSITDSGTLGQRPSTTKRLSSRVQRAI